MTAISIEELFALKVDLEAQLEHDFISGTSAEANGEFDFLIGEWALVRSSYDHSGALVRSTQGTARAQYAFGGRAILEEFYNYRSDGTSYRAGIAVYTYRASENRWHVGAVDASTGATSYSPEATDDGFRYETKIELPMGTVHTRNRIFGISNNGSEWEQRVSVDGNDWYLNYHVRSTRKP